MKQDDEMAFNLGENDEIKLNQSIDEERKELINGTNWTHSPSSSSRGPQAPFNLRLNPLPDSLEY